MRYIVQIDGFSKRHNDYTQDLGFEEIRAMSDEEAIRLFNGQSWHTPEGGRQRFTLLVHREGPQGDMQALAERYFFARELK